MRGNRPGADATAAFVVGVDFGTLSARALVVRVADGAELGTGVHSYRHGVMDRTLAATGAALPPDWALQDPQDYLDALAGSVREAVADSGVDPARVVAIGTDFTASTVLPVRADGTPLCHLPEHRAQPHAYVKLWKHHAAQAQADRITDLARDRGEAWLGRYGGRISAEWQFAKALQLLEEAPEVYAATDRWIEAADWIVWQLCGSETRNPCTAGYKGMHQDGGYPSPDYLAALHPGFADVVATRLAHPLSPLGARAGALTLAAAAATGLPAGIAVAVGNVDAHVTAPAAQAVAPGHLLAVMGTSTCHVVNAERLVEVPGMCGVVDGGIVAGLWGYEAGQSGVGDIFAWFVEELSGGDGLAGGGAGRSGAPDAGEWHRRLSAQAAAQDVGEHGLVALDWWSGNRSVLVDHELSGLILGLTLATRPADIYRALVESTAFGTRMIVETFVRAGVPVERLVVAGGLLRNPFVLQVYADVTRRPLYLIGSDQGPALGSAIHAAVAAGRYPDVPAAAAVMGRSTPAAYQPDPARADAYDALYAEYVTLHDLFGRAGGDDVMHRLRARRNEVLRARHATGVA